MEFVHLLIKIEFENLATVLSFFTICLMVSCKFFT